MHSFKINGQAPYVIRNIESLRSPRLLVFEDRVLRNMDRMKSDLEEVAPGSEYRHLYPHLKTHKSSHILRMMMDAGMSCFKTTLNEAEMATRCGAKEIFVAYPLLELDAVWLSDLMKAFPDTRFLVQIGSLEHARILKTVAEKRNALWQYFIDVDVGMHRTGIAPEDAYQLYVDILEWEGLEFTGLHGYDGHNHHSDEPRRKEKAEESMSLLLEVVRAFQRKGVTIERVVAAGSITFQEDLRILYDTLGNNTRLQVSPGNWIYWDSEYDKLMPGAFEIAAMVLAQVIEVGEETITLNLGHKRWGADRGPIEIFSRSGLRVTAFNEEHTVLTHDKKQSYEIGEYILIVPRHACSTVNLYEDFTLVNGEGKIVERTVPIDARNR